MSSDQFAPVSFAHFDLSSTGHAASALDERMLAQSGGEFSSKFSATFDRANRKLLAHEFGRCSNPALHFVRQSERGTNTRAANPQEPSAESLQ